MIWRGKVTAFVYIAVAFGIAYLFILAHADSLAWAGWILSAPITYLIMRRGLKT